MTFGNDRKEDRISRTSEFAISVSWLLFLTSLVRRKC